jgi:hypothetical protein
VHVFLIRVVVIVSVTVDIVHLVVWFLLLGMADGAICFFPSEKDEF